MSFWISPGKSASVYRWGEVAIAISVTALVKAEPMRHLIGTSTLARSLSAKSASGKLEIDLALAAYSERDHAGALLGKCSRRALAESS